MAAIIDTTTKPRDIQTDASAHASIVLQDIELTLPAAGGPVNVLRGVNLTVKRGELASVVGPSGSGKTTLLMLIAGLERPTSGRAVVDGHNLATLDEDGLARFRRGRVGIVFQSFHLVATMTALENIAIPLEFSGVDNALERARQGLAAVGLERRAGHYPAQLSGGEQQRVAIARAFTPNPSILLADEPTGNLDQKTGAAVMELLFDMQRSHGATLMLVTHDLALAERCGRIITMRDGQCFTHEDQDGSATA
jgi:putative ABC transport system ATP-binding protein